MLERLRSQLGYEHIVLIPDPGEETGHADGSVAFIDDRQLAICGYNLDKLLLNLLQSVFQTLGNILVTVTYLNIQYGIIQVLCETIQVIGKKCCLI